MESEKLMTMMSGVITIEEHVEAEFEPSERAQRQHEWR